MLGLSGGKMAFSELAGKAKGDSMKSKKQGSRTLFS